MNYLQALSIMAECKYSRVYHWKHDQKRFKMFSDLCHKYVNYITSDIESICNKNNKAFIILAPLSGPWFMPNGTSVQIKPFTPTCYEAIFDSYITQYTGYISLWDDNCGVDNFRTLVDLGDMQ